MSNPKLALIPSGYKSGKVYSILPNDATGDFDYERDGNATRVRKDGLIEELTVDDTPRLDWLNNDCPCLLLEPQRVNRQFYSEQIDNALWTKVSTTVTADQTIAPSGEYTADKVQRTSTAANYVIDSASKSASAELDITTSLFVKKGEGDFFAIRQQGSYPNRGEVKYQFSTNTLTTSVAGSDFTAIRSSAEDYGNGWIRISATFNTDANATVGTLFSPRATDGTVDASDTSDSAYAYVWGVQVEEGSYPTSYIKTEGGTSTRLKDECLNGGDSDLFDFNECSIYLDLTPFVAGFDRDISLSAGTNDDRFTFFFRSNGTQLLFGVWAGGSNQLYRDETITYNTRNKLLLTAKENEFKIYINGTLKFTDTFGVLPTGLNRFSFASPFNVNHFEGKIHDTRVYDRVLTEAEAIELTT